MLTWVSSIQHTLYLGCFDRLCPSPACVPVQSTPVTIYNTSLIVMCTECVPLHFMEPGALISPLLGNHGGKLFEEWHRCLINTEVSEGSPAHQPDNRKTQQQPICKPEWNKDRPQTLNRQQDLRRQDGKSKSWTWLGWIWGSRLSWFHKMYKDLQ